MKVHFDHPWSYCVREWGSPIRLYIASRWGYIQIGEKSQVFANGRYTDRWSYITRRPRELPEQRDREVQRRP